MRRAAERGLTAPTWPKDYGGGGLTAAQARVIDQEIAKGRYRPPLLSFGIWMLGPVLLEYGNDEQKREHMPKITRGEIRWCQGYSEPGAGSDLASLATRCEDKGDHWLINGQKVWTSYADKADWCFCLVRTDASKKHEGISFVLIDMRSPGVETRPIQLISGESPFCETFFTDVKIPKGNLVGKVNGGWEIAKRLLQYERQNISAGFGEGGSVGGGASGDLAQVAKQYIGTEASGRLADLDLRQRITRNKMDFQSLRQTIARTAAESRASNGPSAGDLDHQICGGGIGQGAVRADGGGHGLARARLGGRRLQPRRADGRARLAPGQGQFDRGRHLGGQPERGLQAGARAARPKVRDGPKIDEMAAVLFRAAAGLEFEFPGTRFRWRILAATLRPSGRRSGRGWTRTFLKT
jgi:alkylation response protein AidB-like acyl-CoA dehydrogenase